MAEYLDYTGLSHFKDKLDDTYVKDADLSTVATSGSYNDLSNKPTTMTGATSSAAGSSGFVPAPSSGDNTKFLRGDGQWSAISSSGDVAITTAEIDAIVNGSSS